MQDLQAEFTVISQAEHEQPGKRLGHRGLVEAASLPFKLKTPDGVQMLELGRQGGGIVLQSVSKGVLLNGKAAQVGVMLKSGDLLQGHGYVYQFYLKHEARPVSFFSEALAKGSRVVAIAAIALEVCFMLALPYLVNCSSLVSGTIDSQRIVLQMDSLRYKTRKMKLKDPFKQAVLSQLQLELDRRSRYLRYNDAALTPRQRRRMLAKLESFEAIVEKLEATDLQKNGAAPDRDKAVKDILGEL